MKAELICILSLTWWLEWLWCLLHLTVWCLLHLTFKCRAERPRIYAWHVFDVSERSIVTQHGNIISPLLDIQGSDYNGRTERPRISCVQSFTELHATAGQNACEIVFQAGCCRDYMQLQDRIDFGAPGSPEKEPARGPVANFKLARCIGFQKHQVLYGRGASNDHT